MRDGLVTTARQHDARLRLAAAPAGLQDTAGQASDLQSLTADDPACYVVNPLTRTNLISALTNIPDGTPIINVDSPVGKEAAEAVGVEITAYVGTDNVAGGKLAAQAMATLVDRGSRVAVIKGIPGRRRQRGPRCGLQRGRARSASRWWRRSRRTTSAKRHVWQPRICCARTGTSTDSSP